MSLSLTKFTPQSLQLTRNSWVLSANELNLAAVDYEMVCDWAEKRINYEGPQGDSLAYGVFDSKSEKTIAIVEVVFTQRSGPDIGWLKMLNINLCPEFSPFLLQDNAEKLSQVLDIYAESTIGTMDLTGVHKARVLKIYGRNPAFLSILVALNERLKSSPDYTSRIDNRWLVLTAAN